jgi:hypothetical protein
VSICALWACRVSWFSSGTAAELIRTSRPPATVIRTWTGPCRVSAASPVNVPSPLPEPGVAGVAGLVVRVGCEPPPRGRRVATGVRSVLVR